jgi:hypothetical protein
MRSQVPGLALDRNTGVLAGTPEQAGSYTISLQVADNAGGTVSKDFALTIEQPQLRITNNSPLPAGTVGTAYQQRFLATGGRTPYTWSIAAGTVPGLMLDPNTGILSNIPSTAGSFTTTVQVRDNSGATTSRVFSIAIAPGPLQLAPISETLQSTAGSSLSVALSASGGTPPYVWTANGLPEGVETNAASGEVFGTPRTVGSFLFTVRVTDAARATVTDLYRLDVVSPTLPTLTASGISDLSGSADQVSIQLQLAEPYTLPLTGQLTLTFAPEIGSGDPAVQFSTGGRTVDFRIPAGATVAEFPVPSVGFQTGTVAGTIALLARLQTQGVTITPTPVSVKTTRVERSTPVVTSTSFTRSASGIEVRVTGFSTSREISQAVIRFQASPGNSLTTSELTLPLDETFGRWFRDTESAQYGGQFTFAQQFSIQGDVNAVTPVSVTLTNRVGSTTANIRQ